MKKSYVFWVKFRVEAKNTKTGNDSQVLGKNKYFPSKIYILRARLVQGTFKEGKELKEGKGIEGKIERELYKVELFN